MTEIPEHLLKRSRDAKAKASGETPAPEAAAAPSTAPAVAPAASPAVTAAAAPAVPAEPVVKPDPPYIVAAKTRAKVPFWAMTGLAILPLWLFMYMRSLTPTAEAANDPLGVGTQVYAGSCSSCHLGDGSGTATGPYQLNGGEVLKTFPHIEDQLRWVYFASDAYATEGVKIAGDPNREGGPHIVKARGAMTKFGGQLTDAQILAAVCHERFGMTGNADPTSPKYQQEFADWCAPDAPAWLALNDGSKTLATVHEVVKGAIEIGTKPVAGSSAS